MKSAYILGIESSCDDTSAAVLKDRSLLSNVIASQKIHEAYGGVVPELASRAHEQNIVPVVDQALKQAGISKKDLSAIAFTLGPGLMGSLLVGTSFAKGLALALNLPLIQVNHLQGHVLAHFIQVEGKEKSDPNFPFICLLVSGGNSQLVLVHSVREMEIIGQTIDECPYTKYMHHCLISDREGIALEKIHPDLPSAEANSWLSAAADASYGTPGRVNSQYRSLDTVDTKEGFFVEQDWLSPLGNSKYKQLVLGYSFTDRRVANIKVYNRSGALLYSLAENTLLGARGFFVWQGVDSKGNVPDAGSYLIHIEHFNLEGDSKKQDMICRILP
jgi:hypothetical protein